MLQLILLRVTFRIWLGIFGLLLFGSLASCSSLDAPTVGLAGDDHLIVPGERVGPIRLGMSEDDLLNLGKPSSTEPNPLWTQENGTIPAIFYSYFSLIDVWVERSTHRVVKIVVGNDGHCGGYHTTEDVTCGSYISNILGAYGNQDFLRKDDFGPKALWTTYFNYTHSPSTVTEFNFHPRYAAMDVRPGDTVLYIELKEKRFENR